MIGLDDGFFTLIDSEKELVNSLSDYRSLVNNDMTDLIYQNKGDLAFISNFIRDELSNIKLLDNKMSNYYYTLLNVGRIYQSKVRQGTIKIKSQEFGKE